MRRGTTVVLLAGLSLGACVGRSPSVGPLGADFGNATAHNAAVQILDPAPSAAGGGPPALQGARAAEAIRRYLTGTVTEPPRLSATSGLGD